jgi:hypothetical protein
VREEEMKKSIVATGVSVAALVGVAAPVSASHVHSMLVGSGVCVLLAQDGGEKWVILPFAGGAENRLHPLHVLVHLGEPGQHVEIGVYGTASDPCIETGRYVND